jgi:phosphinothricin acetyltransferase
MRVRVATPADADAITAIYAPIVATTAISFEIEPPTVDQMRERIETTLQRFPWLVSEDAHGKLNGYAHASRHRERAAYRWAVDTAIYVRADARHQGIGQRLYAALFDELVGLGYFQAFAGITLPNTASVAVHEAVGFVPVGVYRNVGYKLGAWHDLGRWQKTLCAPQVPTEPRAFGAER